MVYEYEKATEKNGYKNFRLFCSYFGCMPERLFFITESKYGFLYL
jgi:hypothetical protein